MTRESALWVLQDDPAPFNLEGGATGVLLLHGFGGTPREMRPLGDYLHARDLTVSAPLLPCHGSTLAEMNRCRWREWASATEAAHARLRERCAAVFVGGFSMGSLLALWLAEQRDDVTGMILYSPAIKVADWRLNLTPALRYLVRSFGKSSDSDLHDPAAERWLGGFRRYPVPAAAQLLRMQRRVVRGLDRVRAPALVVYSLGDRSIHPQSGPETVRRLARRVPVKSLVLRESGHAVVVDQAWERVAEATYRFIRERAS